MHLSINFSPILGKNTSSDCILCLYRSTYFHINRKISGRSFSRVTKVWNKPGLIEKQTILGYMIGEGRGEEKDSKSNPSFWETPDPERTMIGSQLEGCFAEPKGNRKKLIWGRDVTVGGSSPDRKGVRKENLPKKFRADSECKDPPCMRLKGMKVDADDSLHLSWKGSGRDWEKLVSHCICM